MINSNKSGSYYDSCVAVLRSGVATWTFADALASYSDTPSQDYLLVLCMYIFSTNLGCGVRGAGCGVRGAGCGICCTSLSSNNVSI